MADKIVKRSIRRSIAKRRGISAIKNGWDVYTDRRTCFEVEPIYKGWFKWRNLTGWVVNALRVEGAMCAAVGGSMGYVVKDPITEVLPTKFSAYRWIIENIRDYEDIAHYLY
jgi:hypothetical protein